MNNLWVEDWTDSATCVDGKKRPFKMSNIWQFDGDKTIRKIGVYLHDPDGTYSNECCYDERNGGFKFYKTNCKMSGNVLYKVGPRRQFALVKLEDATFFTESNKDTLQDLIDTAS